MSLLVPQGNLVRRAKWNGVVDYVNPSQLKLVSQGENDNDICTTAWAIRYLHGIESRKIQRGPLLGKLLHRAARQYYATGRPNGFVPDEEEADELWAWAWQQKSKNGGTAEDWCEELKTEAIDRFMPGIPLLPPPPSTSGVPLLVESEFRLHFRDVLLGGTTDLRNRAFTGYSNFATVWDHKTTRGKQIPGVGFDPWYYVPTVEQLSWDPQYLQYALKAAAENPSNLYISGTWVYYLTSEKHKPQARAVTVTLDRHEIEARYVKRWLPWARYIQQWQRWVRQVGAPPPLDAFRRATRPELETAPCNQYGGCPFSNAKGGPCRLYDDNPHNIALAIANAA